MKNLSVLVLSLCGIFLSNGCSLHHCKDIVSREFTNVEKQFIPYYVNDTITFINQTDQKEYQFYCTERYFNNRDSSYIDDYYCENGGYFGVNSRLEVSLSSNLTLPDKGKMIMTVGLGTYDEMQNSTSRFRIQASVEVPNVDIAFNPHEFTLEPIETKSHPNQGFFIETKEINGKEYEDVFGITYFTYQENTNNISRIDTLYYNKEYGLLKFFIKDFNLSLVLY